MKECKNCIHFERAPNHSDEEKAIEFGKCLKSGYYASVERLETNPLINFFMGWCGIKGRYYKEA